MITPTAVPAPDYTAIKQRQKAAWASADYGAIGITLQIAGDRLCEAVDLRAGERVLDVAAGNGSATLAAARHFAIVTSTDFVGALLERGKERANAERQSIAFQEADAEALPFGDGEFDVALSAFGVMFAPHQERAAREMSRVVRKGGRIGLASWTPDGFAGQLIKTIGKHVQPPDGVKPPVLWGTEARLAELFPGHKVKASRQVFNFRYRSPLHWLEVFKSSYGPLVQALASLGAAEGLALEAAILKLLERMNRAQNTLIVPSEYLEAVISTPGRTGC